MINTIMVNIFYFDKSSIETINDSNFDQVMNAGIINDYIIFQKLL